MHDQCRDVAIADANIVQLDAAWSVSGVRRRLLQPVHGTADANVVQRDGARLAATQMRSKAVAVRACQCGNVTVADTNVVQLDAAWSVSGVRSRPRRFGQRG